MSENVTVYEGFTATTSSMIPFECRPDGSGQASFVSSNMATIDFTSGSTQVNDSFVYKWKFYELAGYLHPACGSPSSINRLPTTLDYPPGDQTYGNHVTCVWTVSNIPGHVNINAIIL